ncbi:hypothetical protein HNQ60_000073 [Povalibacter uvarum]|uniref:Phytanoyl-CoA dioxygenase n=1 Tax=Povalibacter uvarum TaxID=732238 RepID=A0A841HEF0_9GAMM|nr:phytanoyl-CoA dioxygenase family protein [Povalibacter uvarum]MBB6091227.1 hypothetical protein [Povalibacter uvarum]
MNASAIGNDDLVDTLHRLRTDGYVVLEHQASESLIGQIEEELAPWFEATPRCEGDFHGWQTTRIASVLLKSPAAQQLLLDPFVLRLLDHVLAPYCDWYQVNLSQAIRLHPGQRQQFPHRDDDMWPCSKTNEYMVNVMWALSDFTRKNGATLLWPHRHLASSSVPDPREAIAAEMPRGSALIYLGSTVHCGGENQATTARTGLVLSYCLGWLKTYENAFLAYPPAIARSFPKSVRDLLGYRMHRPNLGNWEGQDPAIALTSSSRVHPTVDALPEDVAEQLRSYYEMNGR